MSQDQIECARAKDAKRKRESRKQPKAEDPEKSTTAKETALKQSYRKKLSEESKQRVRKEDRIRKAWDREYERRVAGHDYDEQEVDNVQVDRVNQVKCLKGMSKEERKQYNRERIRLWRNSKKQETIKPKLPRWQQIKNAKERYKHKKYMVGVNKAREDMDNEGKVMCQC